MPRVSFSNAQLSAILDALEYELPGELPNAVMDILTRRLLINGNVSKSVDVNPDTSEFVHDYDSDSDSDYSDSSSGSDSFTESGSSSSDYSDSSSSDSSYYHSHMDKKKKAKKAKNTPPASAKSKRSTK